MPRERVFKKLTGAKNYRPWSEWEEGDWVQGVYKEFIEEDRFGKPNYVLELEDGYFINKEAAKKLIFGKDFVLNSVTILDNLVEQNKISIGDTIRVEYLGREVMAKGAFKGKEAISLDIGVASPDEDKSFMAAASGKSKAPAQEDDFDDL